MNNGHRVAERAEGAQQVVAYIRGNKLYVSEPAKGKHFGGAPNIPVVTTSRRALRSLAS